MIVLILAKIIFKKIEQKTLELLVWRWGTQGAHLAPQRFPILLFWHRSTNFTKRSHIGSWWPSTRLSPPPPVREILYPPLCGSKLLDFQNWKELHSVNFQNVSYVEEINFIDNEDQSICIECTSSVVKLVFSRSYRYFWCTSSSSVSMY